MFQDRINRGVALLDEKLGEAWVWKVDVNRLNIARGCDCVLGQCFGGFEQAALELEIHGQCWKYGFNVWPLAGGGFGDQLGLNFLNSEWRSTILALRAQRPQPPIIELKPLAPALRPVAV